MKRKRFVQALFCLIVLLCALAAVASAGAEAGISFSPENPRVGDYVDITVLPGREGALGVRYELITPAGTVCQNKEESSHFTSCFRPREEAVYTLTAVIVYGKKDTETVSVSIPVSGSAPVQEGADITYSQKDGWWHRVMYRTKKPIETLEKGGCAIFSLSHILQRLGHSGGEIMPDALAAKYSRFYIPGRGTDNPGLINQASGEYGFVTQDDLIETVTGIVTSLRHGDLLTFSVVLGHIAMADGISEDGTKVHVVDSAPGATYERKNRFKTKGHIFHQLEDGTFEEAESADQLPGIRWFFETGEYGGMSYWMDIEYCAYRGMRMIRRPWLHAETEAGTQSAVPEYAGALVTRVTLDGVGVRVPTRDLRWATDGAEAPQIAVVTNKKGANLLDGDGKTLERYSKKLNPGAMMMVLGVEGDLCYVFWKDTFCYIARSNVDLLPVQEGSFATGVVSAGGKTSGTVKVTVRNSPKKNGARITEWTIGTPVAVVEAGQDYSLVEGKGYRGWIPNKNLTLDTGESE